MSAISELLEFISKKNLWEENQVYKRNEIISDKVPMLYFIVDGCVKITINIDEQEQIIRLGYKNSLVADLDLFLNKTKSNYKIQTIKKTSVKSVSKQKLIGNLLEFNKINLWISILEELILQQTEREFNLLNLKAKTRYERVLERSPQLFQEVPHKYIASYLRMSSETLSRLLKS